MAEQFDSIVDLAQELADQWGRVHGGPSCQANALVGRDSFAVLMENAFTQAEIILAEQPSGRRLLERYVEQLFAQACGSMVERFEASTGRKVASTGVNLNLEAGWIMFLFKLEGPALSAMERPTGDRLAVRPPWSVTASQAEHTYAQQQVRH